MILDALTGWTLFSGLLLGIGVVAGRWIILPSAIGADDARHDRLVSRSAGLGAGGALLVFVGLAFYLVRQVLEFRDPFAPLGEDLSLLMSTSWGTSWVAAAVGSLVVAAGMLAARSGRNVGWWVATPAALLLAGFPGLTGHASGADELRALALAFDGLHVWAAGAWMGGLALVLYLEARERSSGGAASLLPDLVPAFSPVAMASVALLVLTGLFASWSHLEGLEALWTTSYGRILSLKLLLVAAVLGFGARNFRLLTPLLGTDAGDRTMRRSAAVELAIAQIVLIVTAILVRTSPMGH